MDSWISGLMATGLPVVAVWAWEKSFRKFNKVKFQGFLRGLWFSLCLPTIENCIEKTL
jgi:hypothetical protein